MIRAASPIFLGMTLNCSRLDYVISDSRNYANDFKYIPQEITKLRLERPYLKSVSPKESEYSEQNRSS